MLRRLFVPVVVLAAVLAVVAIAQAGDPPPSGPAPEAPLDAATEAFKAGNYARVVNLLEGLPPSDPVYPKARYLLGESWLALGDAESAAKVFRDLLEKKPESVPVLTGLGRALTVLGKKDEALKTLARAVKADPKDVGARRALGQCLAAQDKPVEARKELEAAAKLDPKDPLTARALVEILVRAGDAGSAGKAAEAHARADPKGAMGDFLRALVLDRNGSSNEAIAGYEAALAKDPKFLDAHKNLAILCVTDNPGYKDKERTEKALVHFAKYFELGGKDDDLKRVYEEIRTLVKSRPAR